MGDLKPQVEPTQPIRAMPTLAEALARAQEPPPAWMQEEHWRDPERRRRYVFKQLAEEGRKVGLRGDFAIDKFDRIIKKVMPEGDEGPAGPRGQYAEPFSKYVKYWADQRELYNLARSFVADEEKRLKKSVLLTGPRLMKNAMKWLWRQGPYGAGKKEEWSPGDLTPQQRRMFEMFVQEVASKRPLGLGQHFQRGLMSMGSRLDAVGEGALEGLLGHERTTTAIQRAGAAERARGIAAAQRPEPGILGRTAEMLPMLGVGMGVGAVSPAASHMLFSLEILPEMMNDLDKAGVSPQKAAVLGGMGAFIYGAIEHLQVKQLTPTIRETMQELMQTTWRGWATQFAKARLRTITAETMEEGMQALTQRLTVAAGRAWEGHPQETVLKEAWGGLEDALRDMKHAAGPMALLSLAGNVPKGLQGAARVSRMKLAPDIPDAIAQARQTVMQEQIQEEIEREQAAPPELQEVAYQLTAESGDEYIVKAPAHFTREQVMKKFKATQARIAQAQEKGREAEFREAEVQAERVRTEEEYGRTMAGLMGEVPAPALEVTPRPLAEEAPAPPAAGEGIPGAVFPGYEPARPSAPGTEIPMARETEVGPRTVEGKRVEVPEAYRLSETAQEAGEVLVEVDVERLDEAWKEAGGGYYLERGEGWQPGRTEAPESFLGEAARVSIDPEGRVGFVNGRHRLAILRDAGVETVSVAVSAEQAATFQERFGPTAEGVRAPAQRAEAVAAPPTPAEAPRVKPLPELTAELTPFQEQSIMSEMEKIAARWGTVGKATEAEADWIFRVQKMAEPGSDMEGAALSMMKRQPPIQKRAPTAEEEIEAMGAEPIIIPRRREISPVGLTQEDYIGHRVKMLTDMDPDAARAQAEQEYTEDRMVRLSFPVEEPRVSPPRTAAEVGAQAEAAGTFRAPEAGVTAIVEADKLKAWLDEPGVAKPAAIQEGPGPDAPRYRDMPSGIARPGQAERIRMGGMEGALAREVPSLRPEVLENMKAARGRPRKGLMDTVKRVGNAIRSIFRRYRFVPEKPEFAATTELLRQIKGARHIAQDETIRAVAQITDPLTGPMDLDWFTLKLIVDNQMAGLAPVDPRFKQPLRFGFESEAEVRQVKQEVDAAVARSPAVQDALQRRRAALETVVQDQVRRGLLPETALDNLDTYFHQQVLTYLEEQEAGRRGYGIGKRAYQKRRIRGVETLRKRYDYNTSYLEAETTWMTDALINAQKHQFLQNLDRVEGSLRTQFTNQARESNYTALTQGPAAEQYVQPLRDSWAKVGDAIATIQRQMAEGHPAFEGWQQAHLPQLTEQHDAESMPDVWFRLLNWLSGVHPDTDAGQAAKTIFGTMAGRTRMMKEALGAEYMSVDSLLAQRPDLTAFTPPPGTVFHQAHTAPERLVAELHAQIMENLNLTPQQVQTVLAMGQRQQGIIIRKEIAEQLASMRKKPKAGMWQAFTRAWKVWTLHSPWRVVPYNIRNMTGDHDPVLGTDWAIYKEFWQARRDAKAYFKGEDPLRGDMRVMRDVGVLESGFTVQEIPDVANMAVFDRFFENLDNVNTERGAARALENAPRQAMRDYFEITARYAKYREAVLRIAAFRHYRKLIEKGDLTKFGASKRADVLEVLQMLGPDAAAGKLARELLGDYGNLSVLGQWLRTNLIPFWSWQEINLRRYPRMFINALGEASLTRGKLGGGLKATAIAGVYAAKSLMQLGTLYGAMWAWNHWGPFNEDEEDLADYERNNPHILLGRNADGTIRIFRNAGAMGDWLEWFGLNSLSTLYPKYERGQLTGTDVAREMASSPANKLVQGAHPVVKGIYEVSTGQSLFPDFFNPRRADRGEMAANVLGIPRDIYREGQKLFGNEEYAGRSHMFMRWLVGVVDPRDNALHNILDAKRRFRQKHHPRSPAFRQMRDAVRAGDVAAFRAARRKYLATGRTWANFVAALRAQHPFHDIPEKDRQRFLDSLTNLQREQSLDEAVRYAHDMGIQMRRLWAQAEEMERGD